ncbi:MAG: sugar ABC transporter ATP-binding protein [Lachnospiraceae bacterium]|nr:sugar ABC transporter ATP-binding protein [Lachnospiraceae bacterium]
MADKKDGNVLSIRGMSKSFGRNRVLDRISLDVKRGTVMGLMGENGAGKSTMMKCLFGTYQKDEGTVFLDGKEVSFSGPKDALENGIAMVHQELNQCLERNVIDNLFLGRYPVNSMGVIDEGRMKKEASELFRKLGMTVNLTQPMRHMSVSQRQMCEIAKAISYNAKVIVLDEPTSSLTVQEVNKLFSMMRMLKEQGIALIYISHKMDEIFEICDEISVLRDGNLVMTKKTEETNMNELIAAMVGRSLENRFPPVDNEPKGPILSIQHLSTKFEPHLQDITFDVREGEIFGLYGLVGAGRTELLETIFGIRTRAAGRVYFNNQLMNFGSAREAMDHGFALITEERKANGLFLKGDLTFNTTIANLNQYKSGLALSDAKMVKATAKEIKIMHTKCMGPEDMISSLSGGNQQKVIFGKWLERSPRVFMMDEPTRGIDVGAKYEIYELIINMAKQGKTIIVVSSEMPEILGITNRIGVMSNGHLSGIVNTKETNQEELLRLSAKYL